MDVLFDPEILLDYIRVVFQNKPEGLARFGTPSRTDAALIMRKANEVFANDERIMMLNMRYEIGQGLDSYLIGDDPHESDADYQIRGYAIAGVFGTFVGGGMFFPAELNASARQLVRDLPEGDCDIKEMSQRHVASGLRTLSALTLQIDSCGHARVEFHCNPIFGHVEAGRFLRQVALMSANQLH